MDTLSSHACRSIQSYWRRRRAYERLGGGTSPGKNRRGSTVRLGGGTRSRRARTFRLTNIRVKLQILSPKKLLGRLRDAYVSAMLSWSGDAPARAPAAARRKTARSRDHAGGDEVKIGDFEMRMIMDVYNTVMANPREVRMVNSI